MGARPMARLIQTQIKTPLADEVLFGRLKNGGVVKVVVTADDTGAKKLGFVYPEGPAQPRMERDLIVAAKARGRARRRIESTDAADNKAPAPGET
jgi:ATP-dependent Clp protease ATP-binding subunit ClpA